MGGHLTDHEYNYMARNTILLNCPITLHDIIKKIYMSVPNLEGVRENT